MERKIFEAMINATPQKVWEILWNDETYRQWTAVFAEGSNAKTDWKTGSKVLFLDGQGNGMVSTIDENRAPEFMSIRHLGVIKNGTEDTTSEEVKKWAGAMENYELSAIDGRTHLKVAMDVAEDYEEYFENKWPLALEKVKALSEK
ncbi:MAG TPA: SRPBCC domain-containing protein [Flavisolibacter sp.]|nr:SRPBCC domain-containing protein [Flavisolibacter sp.]